MAAQRALPEDPAVGKLQRTLEILRILYDREFFSMMRRIAVAERRPTGPGTTERRIPEDIPHKVRKTLEALGPTFIKMGQLMGTRPDLVPKPFVDEFRNLYDKTEATPYPAVKQLIERELGVPLHEVFVDFEEEPVASASIGQVHFARLRSGEKVAVKVQHPAIERRVWTDFEIMRPLVRFIENLFAASRVWQPSEHLHEIAQMLQNELDYRHEAQNHQRVYDNFEGDPHVKIPRIHWDLSTKRVLTLERIEGIKFNNVEDPRLDALDGPNLARIITHAMAEQIFEHRLFHADPSPGNLMAIDSETVAFLDFGAVGKVPKRRADRVFHMILGFMRQDVEGICHALVDICNVEGPVDMRALQKDVEKIADYHDRERASVGDPDVLDMIIQVANEHDMLLPPDFILITRALFQFEGLCRNLDPDYEVVEVLEPYMLGYLRRRVLSVEGGRDAALGMALSTAEVMRTLPRRVNSFMRRLEGGDLRFTVDMAGRNGARPEETRQTYRESLTWLVGAIVVGTGLVLGLGGDDGTLVNFLFFTVVLLIVWAFGMLFLSEE